METTMKTPLEPPIELRALQSLGLGFDLTSDFRLRFAKGIGKRLVVLDEENQRDIVIPGGNGQVIHGVSKDIRCDKGDRIRFKSDLLEFNQMSELLNQKSMVQGKVPSGFFNAIFDLTGAWMNDANDTKYLASDGYFISLYYLHLTSSPLILRDEVKKAVPPNWDPASLSRFIQRYGTHIIVGMAVGGQDVICVRQKPSSSIPPAELKAHLEDLGDSWFSDGRISPQIRKKKVPDVFYRVLQASSIQLTNITETSSKDGLSIICSKRGGNVFLHNHHQWLQTVSSNPDAILFKFVPITSLLSGIPGSGYLSHAINLYLRYKPPTDELEYFLEFQVPRQWAPMYNELPLGPQRRKTNSPSLQFSFMGPKLHINSIQVSSSRKPVLGLRLYLEGKKCNRLAIHIQHLSSPPRMLEYPSSIPAMKPCLWRGSDDLTGPYLEPIKWRRYSNVCTSPVKHDPKWVEEDPPGVYVVTGAQLLTKGNWPKTVLHLRLLYSHLPDCSIQKTEWDTASPSSKNKAGFFTNLSMTFTREITGPPKQVATAMNSGVYPDGPPVPIHSQKLLKFVDISERSRGPHDEPGHWLVTAAKLVTEGSKIGMHVKFALLNYPNKTE